MRRNSAPDVSQGAPPASTSLVRRASDSDVVAHRQQHSSSSSWFYDDDDEEEEDVRITIDDDLAIPAEYTGQFWDEQDPDPEMMLANNLTEARSARAEERRKRKRDHERIRELGILLSLGSEVRQWEERLAWESAFCNNDASMELDHVEDAASRRRSKSLPTTPAFGGSSMDSSSSSSALTPPLPPLSASPLWRVSAEMILRRRSLSERPRRVTPLTAIPFTDEAGVPVGPSTSSGSSGGSGSGSNSSSSASAVAQNRALAS